MHSDKTTRLLLGLILVCLLVLIARDFGSAGSGRFQVSGMRAGSPVLIRVDTESGQVWKLELRGGDNRWVPFLEPGEEPAEAVDLPGPASGESAGVEVPGAGHTQAPRAASGVRVPVPLTDAEVQLFIDSLLERVLPADVRAWAALQLGPIEGSRVTNALLTALTDPEPDVVAAVVEALSQRSDPRIPPALEKLAARGTPPLHDDLQIETLD